MNGRDVWKQQLEALGEFIRGQRRLAALSLRDLAELTEVSDAYLSQVERGLHQPSVKVLSAIARALHLPAEIFLQQAGLLDRDERPGARRESGSLATEQAIRTDSALTEEQKKALLGVYRSFVSGRD